jgi:small subunit ribosomal protein S4
MVSHGHITVNGKKTNIPSRKIKVGDFVAVRPGSAGKGVFSNIDEMIKNNTTPSWISFDGQKKTAVIKGAPQLNTADNMFDLNAVVEFYSR